MERSELVRSQAVGNHFWALCKRKDTGMHWISLCLMQGPGPANRGGGWGYKDMDEDMAPFYYDCPVSYLDAPAEPSENGKAWRAAVREHAQRKAKRAKLGPGSVIHVAGMDYTLVEPRTSCGRRTGWYVRAQHGGLYRISNQSLARAEVVGV